MTFDRYAFDLSKFGVGPQNVVYNTREKYIWELMWPRPDDTQFVAQPSEYRSELHDRFATPLYPLAFVILAYAFLGPPQTTRQSRTLALLGLIGVVALLRLVGFLSVIIGAHVPGVLAVQYVALVGSIVAGSWQISRGQAIEPAAAVSKIATVHHRTFRESDGELRIEPMLAGTLSRYFGFRFLKSVVGTFFGVVALAAMIDYVELLRRSSDWPNATALVLAEISMFRVPQLSERIMPFAVLVGAMSCYLTLSRRLELVVARAAGVSAWQFVAPSMIAAFLFGAVATTVYNPLAAVLHERSKRLEAEMMGELPSSAVHGEYGRLLGASEERRRCCHHQRQVEPRAGRPARRRQRIHFRQSTASSRSGSRQRTRRWSKATGGLTTLASTRAAIRPWSKTPIGSPPT